ncbi:Cyclophilin type peptidyl-prolyl cis-trans isomerase/CLD family protein [Theileria parva strain Muguga]|uniref:Cyclophilin type peptidyl-prolyl cis-trans isomerase/CLD family protein n=1 Tax=Theileria parva strain Muguga TaxID=333668 RepID=UPI001C624578|nr:Cyclophilin type peptidyl-prolyl cis-trans isomerase/CLD family protein [Theileria parva strain Muguga]EAN32881.2 Cyclophilin type peptidyl-prolyl cis-trans isomerase/CLD family protein [Theileria parva strain Muguga]
MSEVYSLEPSCKGRVVLNTSLGDLDIHLWSSHCPKACRNFIQLCLEGYYNNCIFHRVIPNFMVQTGDPSGTGNGGESVYGEPFENEIVSRLKFRNRGMVAMANTGGKCSNMSQFFITLDRSDFLNGKYTLFGKVEGNSIYNLLKIGKCEVDKNDRPFDPPKIISCHVVDNPFDDIVPRLLQLSESEPEEQEEEVTTTQTKDKRLLSFLDSDEEEDNAVKIKSAHDMLQDKSLSKASVQIKETPKPDEPSPVDDEEVEDDDQLYEEEDDDQVYQEEDELRKKEINELEKKLRENTDDLYNPRKKKKPKHDPKKTLERLALFTKRLGEIDKNEQLANKQPETDQDMSDGSWFAGTKLQFSVDSNRAYAYDAGRDTLDVYDPLKGKDNKLNSVKNIHKNRNDGVEKRW